MEPITLPIYNTEGKEVDSVKLDKSLFDGTVNTAAIYLAVNAFMANQRQGLAATKTRGEVSGGGRKPWKQKGTGRARVGSTRSPLWRHGGVIFGPHPRSFSWRLPDKIKTLALKSSLNAKVKDNQLMVVEALKLDSPKTKDAIKVLKNLKVIPGAKTLLLLDKIDKNLKLALRNLKFLDFNAAQDTYAYEVLRHNKLLVTKEGLSKLINRFKK